jgi:DNA mismatch endonuclease (patch repair protein)
MTDIFSIEKRSSIMRSIKGVNTAPELTVRRYLFSHGYRFRVHKKNLPGTPDIVLKKHNTVIFVNGCFWHGHQGCQKSSLPKSKTQFWHDKISRNIERDAVNIDKLKKLGWTVLIVFQCELKAKYLEQTMSKIIESLEKTCVIE